MTFAANTDMQADMSNLPATRLSQYAVENTNRHAAYIRRFVRVSSAALTTACRQHGLPLELAELCAGLLASVTDDLMVASDLPRSNIERTKRLCRVLEAAQEPNASALRLAIAASPLNGRAAVAHWDMICEKAERGKFAWLLGMDTDSAYRYGKQAEQRA